jgi:hypothetical protein
LDLKKVGTIPLHLTPGWEKEHLTTLLKVQNTNFTGLLDGRKGTLPTVPFTRLLGRKVAPDTILKIPLFTQVGKCPFHYPHYFKNLTTSEGDLDSLTIHQFITGTKLITLFSRHTFKGLFQSLMFSYLNI